MKSEIFSLFPTTFLKSRYFIDLSKELEYIKSINYRSNDTCLQSVDFFVLETEEFKKLKKYIQNKLNEYCEKVLGTSTVLDITQSWINVSEENGQHKQHRHPNSVVSGVFYLYLESEMPQITFVNPNKNNYQFETNVITDQCTDEFTLKCESGDLVLFLSSVDHYVPQNKISKKRISLSFNTFPKNSFGKKENLTYCPLLT
jgi:uncharacterized protein (TIGR02466 family)